MARRNMAAHFPKVRRGVTSAEGALSRPETHECRSCTAPPERSCPNQQSTDMAFLACHYHDMDDFSACNMCALV